MQTAPPDLQHLLKLLDDDSPIVRQAVRARLAAMRQELPDQLHAAAGRLDQEQERLINEILAPVCQEELEESWPAWRGLAVPEKRIEQALAQISAFLSGWQAHASELPRRLDELAAEAAEAGMAGDARQLAGFLFGGRKLDARLRGNSANYYTAQNSNLLWVLDQGMGNPLSLACIYMLVGSRLGLPIEGCNFPAHFLARVRDDDGLWLVDCFNRGRFMLAEDVAKHHPAMNPSMEEIIHEPAAADVIIARVLRNLDEAFDRERNMPQRQVVRRLILKLMEDRTGD